MAIRTLLELAKAVGLKKQQLYGERNKPWFPKPNADGTWDADKYLKARSKNVRVRKHLSVQTSPSPVALPTKPRKPVTVPTGGINALQISRDVVKVCWKIVRDSAAKSEVNPQDIDALKKSLAELRQAESDYVAIAKDRGDLIPREDVKAIVGECVSRLVRVQTILENSIATEFSLWLADEAVRAMSVDERARVVRQFVANVCIDVRAAESQGVDEMLKAVKAEV